MRILYLTDRVSVRGGCDHHLSQVIRWAVDSGHRVVVGFGRSDPGASVPVGATGVRIRGLGSMVEATGRLAGLADLIADAEVIHLQNIMNPVVLRAAAATGRALATIQDHRVLCPGPGKTLRGGRRCDDAMAEEVCRACLPDPTYRSRLVELTQSRCDALAGIRLVVLSRYMRDELAKIGLGDADVIPPWVEAGTQPAEPGNGFVLGGRLVAHKGVLEGWRAWRTSRCEAPLFVAGAGPLAHRVSGAQHLGWLSQSELRLHLRRARALLFPAVWQEPFGILGVEALAEATPVVVADAGGTNEWSGAGCVRVTVGDVAAMADAVAMLDGDADLAVRLGLEGQAMVAERFERSAIERRLARLYEDTVGRPAVVGPVALG